MKMPKVRGALWGAAGTLAGALVLVSIGTGPFDDGDYFEETAAVRRIEHLDAHLDLPVLKARIGLETHYDEMTWTMSELRREADEVAANGRDERYDDGKKLALSRQALRQAVHAKTQLVERFKTSNSVLRNSLAFLPTAAQEVNQQLAGAEGITRAGSRVGTLVRKLKVASLLRSHGGQESTETLLADLDLMKSQASPLSAETQQHLGIFDSHVRAILREQDLTAHMLAAIMAVPVEALSEDVNKLLNAEESISHTQVRRMQFYLLALSAVLAGLLLYAGWRLLRSSREVARINRELQESNETLEKRVQERTQELRKTQNELVATARQAGMAEIATNVLHNVGNILNSVNVSAGLVAGTLRSSKVAGVGRAAQLMNDHRDDLGRYLAEDRKGRLLPDYLNGLAQILAREQQAMVGELQHLTRSIDHIKDVVSTQQSYAIGGGVVEPVKVCELAEDALRMNCGTLTRRHVSIIKEFGDVPEARLDRGRVLQILVNLISNANNAMLAMPEDLSRLTLKVEALGSRLRVSVRDEGEGIPPENLTRIFAHGFTTRKAGHGFGLHSCAIAARQMGGTLTAHSDGRNRGATFTLELPIDGPVVAGAAS